MSDAGYRSCGSGLVRGEVISAVVQWRERSYAGVAFRPRERTHRRSYLYALAEGVGFQCHGLRLRQAWFLNRNSVQQYPCDGDRINWRMNEDKSRNAGGAQSRGRDLNHSGRSRTARAESGVPMPGASHPI